MSTLIILSVIDFVIINCNNNAGSACVYSMLKSLQYAPPMVAINIYN